MKWEKEERVSIDKEPLKSKGYRGAVGEGGKRGVGIEQLWNYFKF